MATGETGDEKGHALTFRHPPYTHFAAFVYVAVYAVATFLLMVQTRHCDSSLEAWTGSLGSRKLRILEFLGSR